MSKRLFSPTLRFFSIGAALYLGWHLLYTYIIKPHSGLDELVTTNLVKGARFLLDLVGYALQAPDACDRPNSLGIVGGKCLQVGAPCDGVVLFALFVCFVVAFPGTWKRRLWFLPLGIAIIHLSNLIRIAALTAILYHKPSALAFNHDYTFTVFVYGVIFAMWMWWVGRKGLKTAAS